MMVIHAIVYLGLAGLCGLALYLTGTPVRRDDDPWDGKPAA